MANYNPHVFGMTKHIDGGKILRFNVQANYEAATVLPEYVYLPTIPS